MVPASALASPDSRALSEYQKQDWQAEDGLPQGNVRTIVQDPGGALLIGTGGGMVAFDGLRFTPAIVDAQDEAANEPVNALLFSHNGDLWIGTDGRGVIHRTKQRSVNVSEAAGLTQERVRALFEDGRGAIWVATQNGIERIVDDKVQSLTLLGIVPGDITTPFAADGEGGMFLVTAKGLFHWTETSTRQVPLRHTELGTVAAVYRDGSGRIWVGAAHGAFRLVKTVGGYSEEIIPGVHGPVASIIADREMNIWMGSRGHGICRLSQQGVEHWNSTNGLENDTIRSMFEDDEGNLWIGMLSGGLSRWRQPALIPYGHPEGLPEGLASTVLPDSHGDLWLGTWGSGVFRLRKGRLEQVSLPGTAPSVPIRALCDDRKGGVWIGTWYSGLYHFDGRGARRILTGTESFANAVSTLLVDRSGSLWIGTYQGLLKYDSGTPEPGKAQVLLPGSLITSLKETAGGEILAGTSQGLYFLQGDSLTTLKRKDGLSNDYVISISIDDEGVIWVGTKAGGLDRIEGRKAIHVPANAGLPAIPIFTVLDDGHGVLWMGSSRGVLRVLRSQLHELSERRRRTLDVTLLGKSDGMRSSECSGISQPPAALAKDGSLWFSTARGFVHANPSQIPHTWRPATPRIAAVTIDHVATAPAARLVIPPDKADVDLDFEAIRLADPGQLQYRYKLEGYDPDWTVTHARHMAYKRLPPGHFRFVVAVRDHEGPWSDKLAVLELVKEPYLYQRPWFYALLVAVAVGALVTVFRWRVARAKSRVALILEERNRIARDWHDTLMADFAAISWQIEATKNSLETAPRDAAQLLDLTRNMVKHCQAEARRIIWDLRAGDEPVGLLSDELTKALCMLGPRAELDTQLRVEGDERPLPPVYVHHLVCIGQEAVTNALQHGLAQEVKIRVHYSADRVSMTVQDNGDGFVAPERAHATPGHFGLAVMHERAKKIGGDLKIRSVPGTGTEVSVDVPAPASEGLG